MHWHKKATADSGRPDEGTGTAVDGLGSAAEAQSVVNQHFSANARYWEQIYTEPTAHGVIYQERRARTLAWVGDLSLPPAARVLEIGCGAGLLSADLFRRGFVVDGIDPSGAMVELARARASEIGAGDRIRVSEGDAHSLAFASGSYDLVVALGVLPFLHSPAVALSEIARVLRPGGHVLLSSDNPNRLSDWLDPRLTPLAAPAKRIVKRITRHGRRQVPARRYSYRALARLLQGGGFRIAKCVTLGFGPFTLFAKRLLPEPAAIAVHRRLQAMADRGTPILSAAGTHHLVLATLHPPADRITATARS
jgi:SAM-dependent methyltransferase